LIAFSGFKQIKKKELIILLRKYQEKENQYNHLYGAKNRDYFFVPCTKFIFVFEGYHKRVTSPSSFSIDLALLIGLFKLA